MVYGIFLIIEIVTNFYQKKILLKKDILKSWYLQLLFNKI